MKPSDVISLLVKCIENRWAVQIKGSPGCGKSDCAVQAAKSPMTINGVKYPKGIDVMLCHPCIEEPTDRKGLPGIVNGKAEFLPYGDMRRMIETTEPLLVVAEDFPQAAPSVQAPWMQLLLAREIGGLKISDHVTFAILGNRKTDNAGANTVLSTINSRVRTTVEMTVSVNDWLKWGLAKGMPSELLAYFQLCPQDLDLLSSPDENERKTAQRSMKEGLPFCCPRTASFLGEWLNAGVQDMETICGCIGEAVGTKFVGFLNIYRSAGSLVPQIIANPDKARIPEKADELYAIGAAMSYHASDKNIDNVAKYFDRFVDSGEIRTFFWKAATARKPELVDSRAHQAWAIAHADDIC